MPALDCGAGLRQARSSSPTGLAAVITRAASALRATDVVVYLADFGQTVLAPLPDQMPHAQLPQSEPIPMSAAGRAFADQQIVTEERHDGVRVWIPVVEGSDPTGVIALTLPLTTPAGMDDYAELGYFAGFVIGAQSRYTDVYNLHRRRRSMSLAATMQWDRLPPLMHRSGPISVVGLLEPAYDVGGDCFDYAVNGAILDLAIVDAMGHGLGSAVLSGLVIGSYRHDRREARSLTAIHENIAAVVKGQYGGTTFATGQLFRLDTDAGELSWTNAGHPLPLLLREGAVVGELQCKPTPPWGVLDSHPTVATAALRPGDAVVLYTDGVIEARDPDGEELGIDRFVELLGQDASTGLPYHQIVRRSIRNVLEHRQDRLVDDATVVMLAWDPPARR